MAFAFEAKACRRTALGISLAVFCLREDEPVMVEGEVIHIKIPLVLAEDARPFHHRDPVVMPRHSAISRDAVGLSDGWIHWLTNCDECSDRRDCGDCGDCGADH